MNRVYIGSTFEAEYNYPSGTDRTFTFRAIAASPTTQIASTVFTAEAEDSLKITAPATATAKWKAGEYTLQLEATATVYEGAEAPVAVYSLGSISVVPTIFSSGAKAVDPNSTAQRPKTRNERILDAAWTALEGAADNTTISVNTDSFSSSFESRNELLRFINNMEKFVQAEQGKRTHRLVSVGL